MVAFFAIPSTKLKFYEAVKAKKGCNKEEMKFVLYQVVVSEKFLEI